MRIFSRMLRWLSAGICALILVLFTVVPVSSDTGTYRITDYTVRLEPQNDGTVKISMEQVWLVTGGSIPWVTVGLPNSHFSIEEQGGAAKKVTADNSGGFNGVRIDLDKNYLPGETFSLQFSVIQGNLLERLTEQKEWRIAYTPGWYDNAVINHLQIDLISPVDVGSYSSIVPQPNSTNGSVMTWEKSNLATGAHFTILVQSPDGSFLTAANKKVGGSGIPVGVIIFLVVLGVIVVIAIWAAVKARQNRNERRTVLITEAEKEMADDPRKKEKIEKGFEEYVDKKGLEKDAQGRYYDRGYGDYITPAIWAAVLMNNTRQSNTSTGTRSSCACACVSCACACACACAGGGAAGCAKKSIHECHECQNPVKIPH
jgi:hypothetical protein